MEPKVYQKTRKELKTLGASMFLHGDVVVCGKYRVQISYGDEDRTWKRPRMETKVNTEDNWNYLPMDKQPRYIRDFIEDVNITE